MSDAVNYTPRQGSVAWKVIEFLTTHPDERLTADDVSVKFETGRSNVYSLLVQAIDAGILLRREDLESGELAYKLGAGHPSIKANAARHPSLGEPAAETAWKASRPSPLSVRHCVVLDVAALELKDNVPLPAIAAGRRSTDWPALIARMSVGQSVALPRTVKSTLGKAITLHHADHPDTEFATRVIDAEQIGLWRVK